MTVLTTLAHTANPIDYSTGHASTGHELCKLYNMSEMTCLRQGFLASHRAAILAAPCDIQPHSGQQ